MAGKTKRRKLSNNKKEPTNMMQQNLPAPPNAFRLAASRQLGIQSREYVQQQMLAVTKEQLLASLGESEYQASPYDKAFACAWVTPDTVVVGTKCNHLLCVNVATGTTHSVDLPTLPADFVRPPPVCPTLLHWGPGDNCGIHCIAINQDRTLLATGGRNPNDCAIFKLPTLEPVSTIVGHDDWLFGATWVTERHVVTGSRDGLLKLWHANGDSIITESLAQSHAHLCKVRDVKFCKITRQVASVSTDGTVIVSDAMLREKQKIALKPVSPEVVCLDIEGHWVVCGSRSIVHHMDTRTNRHQWLINSPDGTQGVRSVKINGQQLAFGTGAGAVYFYDLRNQRYFVDKLVHPKQRAPEITVDSRNAGPKPFHLKAGTGWLEHNGVYRDYFAHQHVENAVYSIDWDFNNTRLFVAGGPLAYGLRGCYMGLWR